MPLWQANALKLDIKKGTDIMVRGANGRPLPIEGVAELYACDPDATFWKWIKVIVTTTGSWCLILPKDQKRLLLLAKSYPRFLGEENTLTPNLLYVPFRICN